MADATTTDAITQAQQVAYIIAATCEVFSTMLGQEAIPVAAFVERTATAPASGVVSLVGLAGNWVGTGGISCSASSACRISSVFLMAEYDAINEDVLDAIAEMTNMIIGNVKTALEEQLGPMGLSIPTVIFGRNFQTRNSGNHAWTVVPFDCGTDRINVQLCLTPNRGNSRTTRSNYLVPHLLTT